MTTRPARRSTRAARYRREWEPATTGEVVAGAGRALGGLSVRIVRLLWVRPASTAVLAVVAVVVAVGRLPAVGGLAVVAGGLVALRYRRPGRWTALGRPWRWEQHRVAAARARREGRRLAPSLGLVNRDGRPYRCQVWRAGPTGAELARIEVDAPVADEDLRRRLPEWAAVLALPLGERLVLRPGRSAAHRVVEVVAPPPELPERVELPVAGTFETGLVLGVAEVGDPWLWLPDRAAHALVSGQTGSGKTALCRRVVGCWLAAGGEVLLLDYGKGTAFGDLDGRPGVCRAVDKPACEALLADARAEMGRRYETLRSDPAGAFRRVLVAFEEPFAAMEPAAGRDEAAREDQRLSALLAEHVVQLALLGREAGVHLLLAPQRGDASALGSGAARDQLALRVLMVRGATDASADMAVELARTTPIPGREPPACIRDLAAPPGRALVRDPDNGYRLAQVAV